MPFTVSHVMAVLPGVRWHRQLRLDPTCLVIGSMAPDFQYFVRGDQVGYFSHTVLGIVVWGVPVTLVLAALFHHVVKWPVLLAAPAGFTPLLGQPWHERWTLGVVASVVGSAVLGDLTHILWDGLTHATGLFVRVIPALKTPIELPVVGSLVTYRFLQHASTVVGLAGVGWFTIARLRTRASTIVAPIARARARWTFAACMLIGSTLTLARLFVFRRRIDDFGNVAVAAISGLLAGAILASIVVRADARRYRDAIRASTA
jgi:hypothetical protein